MASQVVAAGLIVYRRLHNQIEYLLLKHSYGKQHWTPPKGHVDLGEMEFDTALRETYEEAGLHKNQMILDETFQVEIFYPVKNASKRVIYWLSQVKDPNVKVTLSSEHNDYKWCSLKEALDIVEYQNSKDILNKATAYLEKKSA
ncbi:bis(5'-nucleosyl)-tetraphosphatase [asymmetrical] isoform X2 [Octopus bimaculoides]|uniref:Bis(5'-nucleosyl)-tetraphosphatase [asymmetrical] n=2 Tax=Octopus bimaculoides TaxID=37653 RepID=A0A0L8H4R1_OCTBM|nr:bis(5'-nucleosyl)-tetraphosphatase [asymmetrical] isoform X2 [Octopus bimaculoides]XP_052831759.1 bis(5'-nucleosyl)-tetraphosphatase [asymmetrical] isoform X2 [Octopus bimaculoides]|eukprot:XP_014775375.1 PREDICTED: bis(5'-nucleosyl)-tetraphosphatase [asymmetrical]-like [Octopus bimaculoides]